MKTATEKTETYRRVVTSLQGAHIDLPPDEIESAVDGGSHLIAKIGVGNEYECKSALLQAKELARPSMNLLDAVSCMHKHSPTSHLNLLICASEFILQLQKFATASRFFLGEDDDDDD